MSKITAKDKIRFFAKVNVTDGCWIWVAARRPLGYGVFGIKGVTYSAHRIMFAIQHPEHEEIMLAKRSCAGVRRDYILHSCDNPSCVNPAHLRMGTATENSEDMALRNRNEGKRRAPALKGQKRDGPRSTVKADRRPAHYEESAQDPVTAKLLCGRVGKRQFLKIAVEPVDVTCRTCLHIIETGYHPASKRLRPIPGPVQIAMEHLANCRSVK